MRRYWGAQTTIWGVPFCGVWGVCDVSLCVRATRKSYFVRPNRCYLGGQTTIWGVPFWGV
jgi:hypothetical protein